MRWSAGNADGERDHVEAAAESLVDRVQAGLVVAGDQQLELRRVFEEILAHEARLDAIAAGQRLDAGFVPVPALRRLDGGDQPGALQVGEVGRMPVECSWR